MSEEIDPDCPGCKNLSEVFFKTLEWLSEEYPEVYEDWKSHLRPIVDEKEVRRG